MPPAAPPTAPLPSPASGVSPGKAWDAAWNDYTSGQYDLAIQGFEFFLKTFPNSPDENFSHKLNRKMFRAGLSSILSQLAREERLAVVESFTLDAPKTKLLTQKLKGMGLDNVLIITDAIDDNLHLSSRNLPHVNVVTVSDADPVSLIRHDKVIITRNAVARIEELFA